MQTASEYNYGWLYTGGTGDSLRGMVSDVMSVSTYALAGGIYVSASSWQDPPQGPPSIHFQSTKQKQSHTWKKKMNTHTCAAYSTHLKIHRADGCTENCTTDKDLRSYIKMQDDLHSPKYFREAEDHSRMQPLDRPVLWRAVEHCRKTGAIFVAVSLTNFGKTKAEGLRFLKHANVPFRIERSPSCNINNIDMAIDFCRR